MDNNVEMLKCHANKSSFKEQDKKKISLNFLMISQIGLSLHLNNNARFINGIKRLK